jgi:hypothetical protein
MKRNEKKLMVYEMQVPLVQVKYLEMS